MSVTRRRFLALCGGTISGIWLASKGLIRLPTEMVFALSGPCSFCGYEPPETFGIAGLTGCDARICNECIDLCFDILAENGLKPPPPPAIVVDVPTHVLVDRELLAQLHRRIAAGERSEPLLDAMAAAWDETAGDNRSIVYRPVPHPSYPKPPRFCSFCRAHQDNVQMIVFGPGVHICDSCIGDAGSLFMRYGWRPTPDAFFWGRAH